VARDDGARDREAEPAALVAVLGGEERLENVRQDRRGDAGPVVADDDRDPGPLAAQGDPQGASRPERVGGIQQ
jgi:hypothetical protein